MPTGNAVQHILAAQQSWKMLEVALSAFNVQMKRENVLGMEEERLTAVSCLESYLDHLAASVREM